MSRAWQQGSTRAWRKTRAFVLARDGHRCQVPRNGRPCGDHATHVDHIVPKGAGGTDDPANLRAACAPCNLSRGAAASAGPTATVHVVIGPPGAGKTTHALERADRDDIVIDLDRIALALQVAPLEHAYPAHVRHVAIGARAAAVRRAVALAAGACDVWIIHAVPSFEQLARYVADGWDVRVIDPGPDVVRGRVSDSDRERRHSDAVDSWYARREQLLAVLDPVEDWTW